MSEAILELQQKDEGLPLDHNPLKGLGCNADLYILCQDVAELHDPINVGVWSDVYSLK